MSPLFVRDLNVVKNSLVNSSSFAILFLADWVEWEKFLRACTSSSCKELILAVSIGAGPAIVRALCVIRMEFLILVIKLARALSVQAGGSRQRWRAHPAPS